MNLDCLSYQIVVNKSIFPNAGNKGYKLPISKLHELESCLIHKKQTYYDIISDKHKVYDYTKVPLEIFKHTKVLNHGYDNFSYEYLGIKNIGKVAKELHTLSLPLIHKKSYQEVDLSTFNYLRRLIIKDNGDFCPWKTNHKIRSLKIERFKDEDFSNLKELKDLTTLEIVSARKLKSLKDIRHLNKLKYLKLYGVPKLTDINELKYCDSLESIWIEKAKSFGQQDDIFISMKNLKSLHVPEIKGYRNYLKANKLHFLTFEKDVDFKNLKEQDDKIFSDTEFLKHIDDNGKPYLLFWDAYNQDIFV